MDMFRMPAKLPPLELCLDRARRSQGYRPRRENRIVLLCMFNMRDRGEGTDRQRHSDRGDMTVARSSSRERLPMHFYHSFADLWAPCGTDTYFILVQACRCLVEPQCFRHCWGEDSNANAGKRNSGTRTVMPLVVRPIGTRGQGRFDAS